MTTDTDDLSKKAKNLFESKKFKEVIELLSDEVIGNELKKDRDIVAELYLLRGNALYEKSDYDSAILDYNNAIDVKPNYDLAYYNRGSTKGAKKEEYDNAIADYTKAIEICQNNADYYGARGSLFRAKKENSKALDDYNKAIEIDPGFASSYYNRGLVKKETNKLKEAEQDFKKYLNLNTNENDTWSKYAKYYIEDINERLTDSNISEIAGIIDAIKNELLVSENFIIHYTSLSTLRSLIVGHTQFRISEGHFLNDSSEGTVFFDFLKGKTSEPTKNIFCSEDFAPKPFICSFVPENKHDDLNMWRLYGKEDGIEAKGCAITISVHKFVEAINHSLSQENDYIKYESDINFYKVAYLDSKMQVSAQDSHDNSKLQQLLYDLKNIVTQCSHLDKHILERRLNTIAFLFKSDVYKHENEVRMIVKGVEFKKKYMMEMVPPRVYIELASIKNIVKQITLGPKVDNINECAAVFYYHYEENPPIITISHLPYR